MGIEEWLGECGETLLLLPQMHVCVYVCVVLLSVSCDLITKAAMRGLEKILTL